MVQAKQNLSDVIAAREQRRNPDISKTSLENQEDQNSPAMIELQKQLDEQKVTNQLLQQQLQGNKESENKKVLEENKRIAVEESAALAEDADLKKALNMVEGDKYEQLTNRELVDIVANAVETSIEAKSKQLANTIEGKIGDLSSQLIGTQKAVMSIATTIDAKDVANKHSDFDKYQKAAATIMQDTPGISVERAYLLAKAEAAAELPAKNELERERPNNVISRSHVDNTADTDERRERQGTSASKRKTGTAGIRDIINAGIDKVMSERG